MQDVIGFLDRPKSVRECACKGRAFDLESMNFRVIIKSSNQGAFLRGIRASQELYVCALSGIRWIERHMAAQKRGFEMTIEKMQKDMVAAMKAKDKVRKDAISNLISAVKKLAIDEGKREDIPEELIDRAVLKEVKTAREQVETCPPEREDLREEYQARLDVMLEYAPKMLSVEEIEELLTTKYAEVIATKNKGQIMKTVMADLKGKAEGKDISQVVARLCQ